MSDYADNLRRSMINKTRRFMRMVNEMQEKAEPVEPAQQTAVPLDTRRLDWLEAHAVEEFVRPETIHSEFADLRMRWALPKLQSYNSIGSRFTVREAIDIELEKESGDAAE